MSDLLVARHEDHAVLTLNRPEKRNALSVALRDAISDALDELEHDDAIKCVVITGNGPVFSAGFDLSEFTKAAADDAFMTELWASSDRYHDRVLRYPERGCSAPRDRLTRPTAKALRHAGDSHPAPPRQQ
jgi:enoyl-CoA hydratase/carnithine racemase